MIKKTVYLMSFLAINFSCLASVIPVQNGISILCDQAAFEYSYNPRIEGPDDNPNLSGDIGFVNETAYASFFTDTSLDSDTAKIKYTLLTPEGNFFDDITVNSRATIFNNEGIVTGHYRIDNGDWNLFFTTHRQYSEDLKQQDTFENTGGQIFELLYTINRDTTSQWTNEVGVQLFRSTSASDYTFSISGTTVPEPTTIILLSMGSLLIRKFSLQYKK